MTDIGFRTTEWTEIRPKKKSGTARVPETEDFESGSEDIKCRLGNEPDLVVRVSLTDVYETALRGIWTPPKRTVPVILTLCFRRG